MEEYEWNELWFIILNFSEPVIEIYHLYRDANAVTFFR
jgi:hypothetical protein